MKKFNREESKYRKILDLEKIGFTNFHIAGFNSSKLVKESKEMHIHDKMIEILYLDKGNQHYKIDDTEYMIKGGDILVIPPDKIHGTNSYPEDVSTLYWIAFKIPQNKRLLNLPINETKYLLGYFLNLTNYHFKGNAKIPVILSNIFKDYDLEEKTESKIRLTNLLLQFLLDVMASSRKNILNNTPSNKINEVVAYINTNPHKKISITNLSKMLNLSGSRFKCRFKKEIGIPPGEFVMRSKINFAKKHYEQYDSIQDLAYSLDFSSSRYFSTVFKKFTGSTPTEYFRNQALKK